MCTWLIEFLSTKIGTLIHISLKSNEGRNLVCLFLVNLYINEML